jgi:hypothetical protein
VKQAMTSEEWPNLVDISQLSRGSRSACISSDGIRKVFNNSKYTLLVPATNTIMPGGYFVVSADGSRYKPLLANAYRPKVQRCANPDDDATMDVTHPCTPPMVDFLATSASSKVGGSAFLNGLATLI